MGADFPAQALPLLRQNDAEFADQTTEPVVERGTLFDEALSDAVQTENGLLIDALDRDEAHVGPGAGFADGGRIVLAAFAAHPVAGVELRGHQSDRVAEAAELACPVVRPGTGFHADPTGRRLGDQLQQLAACSLGFDENRFTALVNAMQSEYILGEIDADGDQIHELPLSSA